MPKRSATAARPRGRCSACGYGPFALTKRGTVVRHGRYTTCVGTGRPPQPQPRTTTTSTDDIVIANAATIAALNAIMIATM